MDLYKGNTKPGIHDKKFIFTKDFWGMSIIKIQVKNDKQFYRNCLEVINKTNQKRVQKSLVKIRP